MSVQIPQNQDHRTNHKKRHIGYQLAGIKEPYSQTEKHPGDQAQIKLHGTHPPFYGLIKQEL